jgi:hypothetical protein
MTNIEEINLKVAAIAGWTEIELWNPSATNKTYIGTNAAHPELGKFPPKYTESLDAIWKVFECLGIKDFQVVECSGIYGLEKPYEALLCVSSHETLVQYATTPALALCRLLVVINPDPIKPNVTIVDDPDAVKLIELDQELRQVVDSKDRAILKNEFDVAANFRDREIELWKQIHQIRSRRPEIKEVTIIDDDGEIESDVFDVEFG